MKKTIWLLFFGIALLADLACILLEQNSLRFVTKPLIVAFLLGYVLAASLNSSALLKKTLIAALLFSLAGDVLLLFEEKGAIFFILGLSSFLVAHVLYILAFQRLRKQSGRIFRPVLLIPVAIYYFTLLAILFPTLGDMRIPVLIYGAVISTMLVMALHLGGIQKNAGSLILGGAVFFVVSDTVLALNKFYHPLQYAGIVIMSTYGLAQLFIVLGCIRIIRGK